MQNANMIILNGRSGHDKFKGNYTSIQPRGYSVTDYVLCAAGLFTIINDFTVHGKYAESDHEPITFSLTRRSSVTQKKYIKMGFDENV